MMTAAEANGLGTTLLALAILVPVDLWVFLDATERARRGHPVATVLGTFTIETPQQWLIGCLGVLVLFLPLYLRAREASP
jgi:hypothetical protein